MADRLKHIGQTTALVPRYQTEQCRGRTCAPVSHPREGARRSRADVTPYTAPGEVVEKRIENRDREQRQQQTKRLTANHEDTY